MKKKTIIKVILFAIFTTALIIIPIFISIRLVIMFFGNDALMISFPFYLGFWTFFFIFDYFDKFVDYLIDKFKILDGGKAKNPTKVEGEKE